LALDKDITVGQPEDGYVGLKVGSGIYYFTVNGIVAPVPAPVVPMKSK
jgi:hypothetical protein